MSDSQSPQEPEETIYQRDKTAKEPVKPEDAAKPKPRPKPKLRKAFVPKKLVKQSDKPQEYRVRNIRLSSLESANLFRQAIIDFQQELAGEQVEDPDKFFHDREKVENYFARIAKKYSICSSKGLGGDLDWVYAGMNLEEGIMTQDLLDAILKTEKHVIPEPIKTRLGYHLILVCENRDRVEEEKPKEAPQPKTPPAGTNIPT
ncbi:hypothetical protein UR09_01515 [Candidatus Nitromaritima sp. SCGC AAA799-A02]|nr:hypothetical protein UR09_01515 [Candidatus Nitromaritima sp. SCGC AAA799-A02]